MMDYKAEALQSLIEDISTISTLAQVDKLFIDKIDKNGKEVVDLLYQVLLHAERVFNRAIYEHEELVRTRGILDEA